MERFNRRKNAVANSIEFFLDNDENIEDIKFNNLDKLFNKPIILFFLVCSIIILFLAVSLLFPFQNLQKFFENNFTTLNSPSVI